MCKTRSHQSREMDCTRHTARQDRHALNPTPRHFHLVGVREVSKALFQLWFFWLLRSPSGFNYFPLLSSGTRVLLLFWLSDSVLVLTTPASTCLGRANHQPMQFSAWFFSVFSTPGRWRCVVSTSAAATLFPHSVLPWRASPEDSAAMFQLWCSVNWGLKSRSVPICFRSHGPGTVLIVNLCPTPCGLQGCARRSSPGSSHHFATQASMVLGF